MKSDGGYYLHNKDNEKIASDIESIEHVSDDLSVIYYEKEEGLYRQSEDEEDPTKISSDICAVQNIYDSGEIYYTKEDTLELNLSDYVIDDMAEADQALTEPEYPDYPDYSDYDSDEEYDEAVPESFLPGSTPAKAVRASRCVKRETSPISAISCGPRVAPTPFISITTGYSGSVDASSFIFERSDSTVFEAVFSNIIYSKRSRKSRSNKGII